MKKKWTISDRGNFDSIDIRIHEGRMVSLEFEALTDYDLHGDLKHLVETRDMITGNDLRQYFDQNFEIETSEFMKIFSDVIEVLERRKDDDCQKKKNHKRQERRD